MCSLIMYSLVEDLREELDTLRMTVASYGNELKNLKEQMQQSQVGLGWMEGGRVGGQEKDA